MKFKKGMTVEVFNPTSGNYPKGKIVTLVERKRMDSSDIKKGYYWIIKASEGYTGVVESEIRLRKKPKGVSWEKFIMREVK